MENEEGLVVRGRVEIDTRRPFRSVKEAVTLFGERVLAGGVYANKLKEVQIRASENGEHQSRVGAVAAELEETKQSLQKAKEEGSFMAYCLTSLQQELEQTKRELNKLKAREPPNQLIDPEIEELNFVENTSKVDVARAETEDELGLLKRRSVKFASPPSLARVIVSKDIGEVLVTPPSLGKQTKRKPLIPLFGGLFSKKKGSHEGESPRS
ncbi:hypothetical protein RJ639_014812 [Escallonia herrerae]|uniref:WEB family protein n=1 Tax=Escallonia herrerae TaxID=1293975 RepID=A0AA88VFF5_9ASTE|nr:hypothetical protein RJ639_014812 [Escallonia herrerae]